MVSAGRPKKSRDGVALLTLSIPSELKQKGGLIEQIDEIAKREGSNRSEWIMDVVAEQVRIKYPSNPQTTFGAFDSSNELALTLRAKFVLRDLEAAVKIVEKARLDLGKPHKQSDEIMCKQRESHGLKVVRSLLPKAQMLSRKVYAERFDVLFKRITEIISD